MQKNVVKEKASRESAVVENAVEIVSHSISYGNPDGNTNGKLRDTPPEVAPLRRRPSRGRWALCAIFVVAGTLHLAKPAPYVRIVPPYLPAPAALVAISGLAEIALGLALATARFRRWAAWGLVGLLVAVFPANVYMYQLGGAAFGMPDWVLAARLPLQLLLIRWAYLYARPYPRPSGT